MTRNGSRRLVGPIAFVVLAVCVCVAGAAASGHTTLMGLGLSTESQSGAVSNQSLELKALQRRVAQLIRAANAKDGRCCRGPRGPRGPRGRPGRFTVANTWTAPGTIGDLCAPGACENVSTVTCPSGMVVLGGGWGPVSRDIAAPTNVTVVENHPYAGSRGWIVGLINHSSVVTGKEWRAFARCGS